MDLSRRATMNREIRTWTLDACELRESTTSDALTLTGEASVVEAPYAVRDMFGEFTETIREGAFDKTLSENPDVMLLVNHDGLPLARTKSGTLKLAADPHLSVYATLDPSDPDVKRIESKMRRGDLSEMSFAFRVTRQEWDDDYTERQILEVNLNRGDVSVVNYGANPATTSAIRALDMEADELADALEALTAGEADDNARQLVERAVTSMSNILRKPFDEIVAERDGLVDQYRLAKLYQGLADRFPPLDPPAA